ncbi:MAG: hypothetical protein MUC35_05235 [Candidatus Margulisbacteria bacterium]|jgi:FlaA1/EpsC-like NDP-sugar epimerase|nr:hypothetical protein [Candidatus Margulisiibacteriota bacterium]
MNRAWRYLFLKIGTDVVLVNLSFLAAFTLKFHAFNTFSLLAIYYRPLLFLTVLWLVVLNLAGLYKLQPDMLNRVDNQFTVSFGIFSAAFFTYLIVMFLYREAEYSRNVVIIASLISLVAINVSRYLIWKLYNR